MPNMPYFALSPCKYTPYALSANHSLYPLYMCVMYWFVMWCKDMTKLQLTWCFSVKTWLNFEPSHIYAHPQFFWLHECHTWLYNRVIGSGYQTEITRDKTKQNPYTHSVLYMFLSPSSSCTYGCRWVGVSYHTPLPNKNIIVMFVYKITESFTHSLCYDYSLCTFSYKLHYTHTHLHKVLVSAWQQVLVLSSTNVVIDKPTTFTWWFNA